LAPRIVLVTDSAFGDESIVRCIEATASELPRGWLCVQLRDKHRPLVSLRVFASRLRVVTRALGAGLVVNGNSRLARDVGADGVHLGGGAGTVAEARAICGSGAWVSIAAHSNGAVQRGVEDGADAILVSPVFTSRPASLAASSEAGRNASNASNASNATKRGRGLDAVRAARILVGDRCAIYALGGVTAQNASACISAGADGVALIRALLSAERPDRIARAMYGALTGR
jgi:thiamine-phosphate pyrophosphorylase